MIGLKAGEIPPVLVETSSNGGLTAEQITKLCCQKLVYVSDNAPPEIRQQAEAFRESIEAVVYHYIKDAMRAERDRCMQEALNRGMTNLAEMFRRE